MRCNVRGPFADAWRGGGWHLRLVGYGAVVAMTRTLDTLRALAMLAVATVAAGGIGFALGYGLGSL